MKRMKRRKLRKRRKRRKRRKLKRTPKPGGHTGCHLCAPQPPRCRRAGGARGGDATGIGTHGYKNH